MKTFRILFLSAFSLQALSLFLPAANVYWSTPTGTWFTPNGWHDGSVTGVMRNAPAASDNAYIEGGLVTIGPGVTATNAAGYVGGVAGSSGTVVIASGGVWGSSGQVYIGTANGSHGSVSVSGLMDAATHMWIGNTGGTAFLDIASSGTVISSGALNLAAANNSQGRIDVAGLLDFGSTMRIGRVGIGQIDIASSGTVKTSADAQIGLDATGHGTVNVAGLFSVQTNLVLGSSGTGILDIAPNGTVSVNTGYAYLGSVANSYGHASVGGALAVQTNLIVGSSGTGILDIVPNGTVSVNTGYAYLGSVANSYGHTSVGGALAVQTNLIVGSSGTGFLDIATGGTVRTTTGYIYISSASTSRGTVNVDGILSAQTELHIGYSAGSFGRATVGGLMSAQTNMYIGNSGTGFLEIGASGTVRANTGQTYIGSANGSYGSATVAGLLFSESHLWVGSSNNSAGFLDIAPSGIVRTGAGVINLANSNGSQSQVNVAGLLDLGGLMRIGRGGIGQIDIASSGTVRTGASASIGTDATGRGTVNVAGLFNVQTNLIVGDSGTGFLNIAPGGTARTTTGYIYISSASTSRGTVNVDGILGAQTDLHIGYSAGSLGHATVGGLMTAQNNLYVGNSGTGFLVIDASGAVRANTNQFYIGSANGSYGSVTVAGLMFSESHLWVGSGNNSAGFLDIAPSGIVQTGAGVINLANSNGSQGQVTVAGLLDLGGLMRIGRGGIGQIDIASSGTVRTGASASIGTDATGRGTVNVAGLFNVQTNLIVGENGAGVLDIVSSGIVLANAGIIAQNANSTGAASVAGLWEVRGNFTIGANATATGSLDIKDTGALAVRGGYTQNARSTLTVALNASRPDAPITVNGAAQLSGTLQVSGLAQLNYTEGTTKASQLSGITIIRAAGGIAGDFDRIIPLDGAAGGATLPDYINFAGIKATDGGTLPTRYDVGYGLAWQSSPALAQGTFTIDSGKTFEVDVQLNDRNGITSGWDGRSLTKKGGGTLILSVENAYSGLTTVEAGTLRFDGPLNTNLGALVNNGIVDLGGSGQRTLSAASLAGSGTYRLSVDIAAGTSDRIIISGNASGHQRLLITGIGGLPAGDEPMPVLISIGGVDDLTYTAGGQTPGGADFEGSFDHGYFNYAVARHGSHIVILNTGLLPAVFDPIKGVPGAQSILWFDQHDNLSRRIGEMRACRESGAGLDLWLRGNAARATIGGGSTGMRLSDINLWSAEIGLDHTWQFPGNRATFGLFLNSGNTTQKFHKVPAATSARGESRLIGTGLYASWMADTGWFINSTLSADYYQNNFDAVDLSLNSTTGDYKDRGFGAAIEAGKRFTLGSGSARVSRAGEGRPDPRPTENRKLNTENSGCGSAAGWFVEPAAQAALARVNRGDYTTKGAGAANLSVHGSNATLSRLRATARVGRIWQGDAIGWLEIAARGSYVRERSSGGEVMIGSATRWRPNLDGDRYEAGLGLAWRPRARSGQIYFDYEYASGDNYQKPWAISLGFRIMFH